MRLTYKYRIYPTVAQTVFLEGQLREACELYNAALQERRDAWKVCRKRITFYDQDRQIKPMREDGCLRLVSFDCATDVLRRVDLAFRAFFRRVKAGERPGHPRFRSFRRYDSITYTHHGRGCTLLPNGKLRVQGAGHIRVKLHRPVVGEIKTATIRREIDKWFVCLSVNAERAPLPTLETMIGIDVGLASFATLSDGSEINNPQFQKKAQAHLRRCQRRLSRRKRGSHRRRKAAMLVAKAHRKIQNQRGNFHHEISRWIVDRYGLIAIESLNVKGLAGSRLARPVQDAAWALFFEKLAYKAESAGRQFVAVDPRGTSQTCVCGESVTKRLSDRWHECPTCGLLAARDHVSARVILQRAGNRPSGANEEVGDSCVA